MKKLLALFLALIMCMGVLVACGGNDGKETTNTDDATEAPATEAPATLAEAKEYLDSMMKDKKGKAIPNDYDVLGVLTLGTTKFEVTWTVNNENIKVVASSKANFWTIDLPDTNVVEVEYTLTATIKATDGSTVQTSYAIKLPAVDNAGIVTELAADVEYKIFMKQVSLGYTVYALNSTQNNENKFINTTMDPKEAASFYAEIVDGGYKFYTMIDGVKNYVHAALVANGEKVSKYIGFATETTSVFTYDKELAVYKVTIDGTVYGVGTYGSYKTISLSEAIYFKEENINSPGGQFPIGFMTAEYANTLPPSEEPVVNDPAADSTLTIAEAIELGKTKASGIYTEGKYYVSGQIKEIQNATYGNLVITDGTNDILVYCTYSADGTVRFGEFAVKPVVGDKIKVYGVIGKYNDAQIKDAWIVEGLPTAGGDNTGGNTGDAAEYTVCSLAEAKAKDVGALVKISGIVVEASAWNTTFGTMSVTIVDADGDSLYVFRMGTQVQVGQFITVEGAVGEYGGAKQIAQGSTATIGTPDEDHKAAFEHYILTVATNYTEDTVVTLPTATSFYDVVITWTATGATIEDGKLAIVRGETEQTITLTATFSTGLTKDFVITVVALGYVAPTATITFDDKSKRTEYSTEKQVWVENGITVTNEKGASTSNVGDYAAPARFYKTSTLTVNFGADVTKIEFACNRADDVTNLLKTLTDAGYTATSADKVVTVTLDAAVSEFSIVLVDAQIRMDGITVYKS